MVSEKKWDKGVGFHTKPFKYSLSVHVHQSTKKFLCQGNHLTSTQIPSLWSRFISIALMKVVTRDL